MSTVYTPRQGSLAHHVIEYLASYGGTLSSPEIAEKFECNSTSVATSLRKAVDADLLHFEKHGNTHVYSVPGSPEPALAEGPLQIASYSDGDVSVAGGAATQDGGVMYTKAQIEQLVRHVTTPHTTLGANAPA